ncbi:MAG TPA: choice-of-anchor D domain-containing protein [Terriglobales bacterium]|nr:choice-of-anchor D domain-containing protein [Terriglobales bacterium]
MTLPQSIWKFAYFPLLGFLVLTVAVATSASAGTRLSFSPSDLRFGGVLVGQSETLSATLINGGTTSVTISSVSSDQPTYTVRSSPLPMTLMPGQSLALNVTFQPTASGTQSALIGLKGTSVTLAAHGWGTSTKSLISNPQSIAFGNVASGSTVSSSVTMTNSRSGSVTLSSQLLRGTGFSVQGLSFPITLSPGESYTFQIAFSPQSSGSVVGSFQALNARNGTVLSIPLSGTGTASGQLSLAPSSVAFGNVTVGSSATKTGSLSATGASVTVTSVSSSSSEFVLTGVAFPKTIAAGQTVPYTITFTPQSSGAASGTLSFASNASTAAESVSGTGMAPVQHSVTLAWTPSASNVSGYNVYRSSTSGGPYSKMNSGLNLTTSYLDMNVSASHTYYYVTTAVSSSGQESTYSNQVQAAIP